MKQSEGFVCQLNRNIYGLKQSPHHWNSALVNKMGFKQTIGDPCLYVATEGEMFVIAVYVDGILLSGKCDEKMTELSVKDLTSLTKTLLLEGEHNSEPKWKCLDWSTCVYTRHSNKIWNK